jgi:PAS domain S-box-containing protein/putative nucleotidyltransferase with HDIG domain
MKKNNNLKDPKKDTAAPPRKIRAPKATPAQKWDLTENLISHIWDAGIVTDLKLKVLKWNTAAEKMYGWKQKEILNHSLTQFIKTQYPSGTNSDTALQQLLECGYWQGEVIQNRKDGALCNVMASISLIKDDKGAAAGYIAINRDITESKRAEESLLQLRGIMDETNDAIFLINAKTGIYIDFNQTACKMLGYSREELIQLGPINIARHMTSLELWLERVELVRKNNGLIFETIYQCKDQSTLPVEVNSKLMNATGQEIIIAVARDISRRKQVEEALRQSELLYRLLAENSSDAVSLIGADGKVLYISPAYGKLLGYTSDEMLNSGLPEIMQYLHPDDRERILQEIMHGLELKIPYSQYEYRVKNKQGNYIWLEDMLRREFDKNGQLIRMIVNGRDITKRKQAEEEARLRSSQLESLRQIDLELAAELDLEKLLGSVTARASELIETSGGGIYLYRADLEKLELVIALGPLQAARGKLLNYGEGLSGKVWKLGQPQVVEDYETWPERASIYEGAHIKAVMGVPIRRGEEFLGVLTLLADPPQKFSAQDVALLELFAGHAAVAIYNASLYQNVQQRLKQLEVLYETNKILSIEYDLNTLLRSIVENARKLLNSSTSGMYLTLASGGALELMIATEASYPIGAYLAFGEGVAGRVAQTRQPIRIDVYSNWEGRAPIYNGIQINAVLEVPMLYRGELIGVLTADETSESKRKFTEEDEHLLSLFASQAAGAIHSARLYSETLQRAQEFAGLYETTRDLSLQLDLPTVLTKITKRATELLGVPNASICLYDALQNNLELVAKVGADLPPGTRIELGDGVVGRVAQTRSPLIVDDYQNWEGRSKLFNSIPYSSIIGMPLLYGGKLMGVLDVAEIEPSTRTFNEANLRLLSLFAGQAASAIDNAKLFEDLKKSNMDIISAYDTTIEGWSRAMDLRDHETEGHTLRVTDLSLKLARGMHLSESQLTHMRRGALLHDIGKMGVPDAILLKEEDLTEEEWLLMRKHPQLAYEMLSAIDYLHDALDIPANHHEKWDGTGYPRGLKGEEIPLAARIFAIVDVWDALRSDRPYRKGWDAEKAIEYIKTQSGTHFDPQITQAFLRLLAEG